MHLRFQDAFEGIDELQDIRSEDEAAATARDNSDRSGGEFEDGNEQSPDEDEVSAFDDNLAENASDDASGGVEENVEGSDPIDAEADEMDLAASPPGGSNAPAGKKKKRTEADGPRTYTRAMPDHLDPKAAKDTRLLFYFGSCSEDFKPVCSALEKWFHEPTLPSRVADKNRRGGMRRSFFVDDKAWKAEAKDGWKWWFELGGEDMFPKKQVLNSVDPAPAMDYMPEKQSYEMPFLMGSFQNQQFFKLAVGQSMALSEAWKSDTGVDYISNSASARGSKRGFILNLGAKVHCLDWVPNQNGQDQYLATSVLPQRESAASPFEAPAFTPQPQHESNIQIWKFQSGENDTMRTEVPPHLELVLCSSWGEAKALKWCPMLCDAPTHVGRRRLGLLAGLWSDGGVRVLDVTSPSESTGTCYLHVKHAAFESHPPSLGTCLTWVSSSRIAAGCANGCVAIWDLPSSLQSSSPNPRPIIYSSISTCYILSIATCYPSQPNILLAVSMSGHILMTDLSRAGQPLLSPATTVSSNRVRVSQPLLIWNDFAQLTVHVEDSFVVKGSTIRRVFANIGLGRSKSNGTSLAGSPCHPFVLVGCANGDVFAMNPLKRVKHGKPGIWQQTWFSHEWRRPTAQEPTQPVPSSSPFASNNSAPQAESNGEKQRTTVGSNGLGRISEGFKVERTSLVNYDRYAQKFNSHNGTLYTTIYEEQSAITALAWNPNLHVSGWAAAGMGDGLLRVEDIAT